MFINYKREIYALAHLNMSTASFKCLSLTKVTVTTVRKLNGKKLQSTNTKSIHSYNDRNITAASSSQV